MFKLVGILVKVVSWAGNEWWVDECQSRPSPTVVACVKQSGDRGYRVEDAKSRLPAKVFIHGFEYDLKVASESRDVVLGERVGWVATMASKVKQHQVEFFFELTEKRPIRIDGESVTVAAENSYAVGVTVASEFNGCPVFGDERVPSYWGRRQELHSKHSSGVLKRTSLACFGIIAWR